MYADISNRCTTPQTNKNRPHLSPFKALSFFLVVDFSSSDSYRMSGANRIFLTVIYSKNKFKEVFTSSVLL